MADIFISYSKQDRDLAERLSAFLQARGWTVWWDRSLTAGDEFRDEIMKQLGLARAAIVIWSKNSVESSWVRSEAGRAQAAQKLIPVKVAGTAYQDIPPPFELLHTEDIANEDLIHGAVVAQLAKPGFEQSPYARAAAAVRYQVLLWAGSIGGGISLFVHFETVLKLSDLARDLVTQWKALTNSVWSWVFSWINVKPPIAAMPFLTLSAFFLLTTLGAVARQRRVAADERSLHATIVLRLGCLIAICGIVGLGSWEQLSTLDLTDLYERPGPRVILPDGTETRLPPTPRPPPLPLPPWLDVVWLLFSLVRALVFAISAAMILLAFLLAPSALVLGLLQRRYRRSWTFLAYLLVMAMLWVAMVLHPKLAIIGAPVLVTILVTPIVFSRMNRQVWDARDQLFFPLTSRLPYFVGILLFLLLLNEIAKLDVGQYFRALKGL